MGALGSIHFKCQSAVLKFGALLEYTFQLSRDRALGVAESTLSTLSSRVPSSMNMQYAINNNCSLGHVEVEHSVSLNNSALILV